MKVHEIISESTQKVDASKPRNFVAKNAKMGGAGQHKDKKKAMKQGDVKHKNKEIAEVSKSTLDRYVTKAVDAHGHADFSAKQSKHDPSLRSYHVDQKKTAEKRRQGISRALDRMSKEGVAEGLDQEFNMQLAKILKKRGYKGPVKLEQLGMKWVEAIGDIVDIDDYTMVQGNDPEYDGWVSYVFGLGKYAYGAEQGYTTGTAKRVEIDTRDVQGVAETATAGSTSAGNVAVGAVYKNKRPKMQKPGTNALDMKGGNLMTGGSIKR
jgi:hypothetical protein